MLQGLPLWRDVERGADLPEGAQTLPLRAGWQVLRRRLSHAAAKDYAQDDRVSGR
jgi:hypothetical protein